VPTSTDNNTGATKPDGQSVDNLASTFTNIAAFTTPPWNTSLNGNNIPYLAFDNGNGTDDGPNISLANIPLGGSETFEPVGGGLLTAGPYIVVAGNAALSNGVVGIGAMPTDDSSNKYFILVQDATTTPVTAPNPLFKGTLDGMGHTVALDINDKAGGTVYTGLFAQLNGATVKNLVLTGTVANKNSTGDASSGAVVGSCDGNNTIMNVHAAVDVTTGCPGNANAGGIVGQINGGTTSIKDCYTSETITADDNAGGIVGYGGSGTSITYCYSSCSISAGIAGCVQTSSTIAHCVFIGNSTGYIWGGINTPHTQIDGTDAGGNYAVGGSSSSGGSALKNGAKFNNSSDTDWTTTAGWSSMFGDSESAPWGWAGNSYVSGAGPVLWFER
jgi:hypothetical protein